MDDEFLGVPARHGGSQKFLVVENPNLTWMMTGGTPVSGDHHIGWLMIDDYLIDG